MTTAGLLPRPVGGRAPAWSILVGGALGLLAGCATGRGPADGEAAGGLGTGPGTEPGSIEAAASVPPSGSPAAAAPEGAPAAGSPGVSPTTAPQAPGPAGCAAWLRPGTLRRSAVVRTVDAGLGRWLAGVDVEPRRKDGRFLGWVVRHLHPQDPCFQAVDVRPGDIVTRINDRPIERPEQANEVFAGLRRAPSLRIELLRDGAPRLLTYPIAED